MGTGAGSGTKLINSTDSTNSTDNLYVLECTNVKGAMLIKPEHIMYGKYGMLTYQLRFAHIYKNKTDADNMCNAANTVFRVYGVQFKVSTLTEVLDD